MMENSLWKRRIEDANQSYQEWEQKYQCSILEDYYRGKQWAAPLIGQDKQYVLNLFYSTIKIKLANYLVNTPYILVTPEPEDANFNLDSAIMSAQKKEAFVNTIIGNKNNLFSHSVKKAIRDSFMRFGVVEVGFDASFKDNPKAKKPVFKSDINSDVTDITDKVVEEPELVPEVESIFFKRISPKNFRVSSHSEDTLSGCDWFGYYDFYDRRDFAKLIGKKISDLSTESASVDENVTGVERPVKVWKIWDNRTKKKYFILDSDGEIYAESPFTRSPIISFRWDLDFDGFYPIPPSFHWLSQQDEINSAREQARNHRKRFTRKFQVEKGLLSAEEKEKFSYGPDGTIVELERANSNGIVPIPNADLGAQALQALQISREDFNIISGTSSEARGVSDRQTATQARIIDDRSNIRETADTEDVNSFIVEICREVIELGAERLTLPITVKSRKQSSEMLESVGPQDEYKQLNPADLADSMGYNLLVDVSSTSPAQNEIEKRKYIEFISMLSNFPQLALSPVLIRETAFKVGYRNERVISEMQRAALLSMMGMQAGAMQENNGTGEPQRIAEAATPPTQNDTDAQLNNQLGSVQ